MTKKVCVRSLLALLSAACLSSIASAQMRWSRTYTLKGDDWGNSVQQTADGGYIIAGRTRIPRREVCLIKTNASGDTLWTMTYGEGVGNSVQQTSDGGFIVAGTTGNDQVCLIRTTASGDTLWTRTYGGSAGTEGNSVRQTTDGGYIIAGVTYTSSSPQVYLVKTDSAGESPWTRTYSGTGEAYGYSVRQTVDGGYVITGVTAQSDMSNFYVYLVKTDAEGDSLWTVTYGGEYGSRGYSVQQTVDGGYIIAGDAYTGAGDFVYLVKTDARGDTLWTRAYGDTAGSEGNSVQQTTEGGYIITGWTYSPGSGPEDVYLMKTDARGDTLWTRTYGGPDANCGTSVQQTTDGGYIIAGATAYPRAGWNVRLIKTDAYGNEREPVTQLAAKPSTRLLAQPNPFSAVTRIPEHETELFTLSDVTGRQVAVCKGDRIGAGLRPGVYFVSPVGSKTGKAVTTTIIKAAD